MHRTIFISFLMVIYLVILVSVISFFVLGSSFHQLVCINCLIKSFASQSYQSYIQKFYPYPALASIIAINVGWNISNSSIPSHIELAKLIETYERRLNQKMKFDLKMKDLTINCTMNIQPSREPPFISTSKYNSKYTLQTFRNVCIDTRSHGRLLFIVNSSINKSNYLSQFNRPYGYNVSSGHKMLFHWLPTLL